MPREVRHLRACPQRQLPLGSVPVGHAAAPLQRRRAQAIGAKRASHDGGGASQRGIHVAVIERSREEQVARHGVVDERRAGAGRIDGVHDGRPRLVLHPDPRGGVLGSVAVRRDDGRERFADVAHAGRGEHGLLGLDVARQRRARANAVPGDELVAAGDDRDDAGQTRGRARVDHEEARVRVCAAHERHVQQARQLDVAHIAAAPGEQARILAAGHRGTERRRRLKRVGHQTVA